MSGVALYRIFDADGRLLYVGVSENPLRRLRQHHVGSRWFRGVAVRTEIEWHQSRKAALAAEAEAIRTEAPVHNQAQTHKTHMAEPAASVIKMCGGLVAVAEMLGVHRTSVGRWTGPAGRHGTGGMIPSWHQGPLLSAARKRGIDLRPEHFFLQAPHSPLPLALLGEPHVQQRAQFRVADQRPQQPLDRDVEGDEVVILMGTGSTR